MEGNEKVKKFMDLLNKIYGKDIIDKVIEKDSISFKSKEELDKIFEELNVKKVIKGRCNECEGLINPKMDLPGWLGKLDFTKTHVRKVMVIGEDPSGKILGISYGLGHYKNVKDMDDWPDYVNLWKYLKKLIDIEDDDFNNFYSTDICKCGAKAQLSRCDTKKQLKNQLRNEYKSCWKKCFEKYLLEEIKLINPEIIIAHGCTANKFLKKLENIKKIINSNKYLHVYHVRGAKQRVGKVKGKKYIEEKRKSPEIKRIHDLIRS